MTVNRKYSTWEWTRAYLVLVLTFPLYATLWFLARFVRRLPTGITRWLHQRHADHTLSRTPDMRIPFDTNISPYMLRWWRLPRNWAMNVYYHVIMRSDDDRAHHDHPWWNFSVVLGGGYYEHEILEGGVHRKTWCGPGTMRFRWHGKKAHRLELARDMSSRIIGGVGQAAGGVLKVQIVESPAQTIFITGPVLRRWGFHHEKGWVDAYEWDDFCARNGIVSMPMAGGSDSVQSDRNQHSHN